MILMVDYKAEEEDEEIDLKFSHVV